MKRRLLFLLILSLVLAAPAAAQSDCGPFLRCGRVPWQMPIMPILVSPTPFIPSAPYYPTPVATSESGFISATPVYCSTPTAGIPVMDTPYKQSVANTRPSAYWPLDETTGTTATDATGSGRHGTYSGATLAGYTGAGGAQPSFDGVNDQVTLPGARAAFNAPQFTVSLWMRPPAFWTGTGTLLYFGDSQIFSLARNGTNIIMLSGSGNAIATITTLLPNPWIHIVAVVNRTLGGGQSARLYLNGNSAATANVAPGTFTSASTLYVGSNGTNSFYPGGIGHIALWNRALSAAEITGIANGIPDWTTIFQPDPCDPNGGGLNIGFNTSQFTDTLALLESVPGSQVGIDNPQAGVDLYSGTATFFSYVLGIQSINLGVLTPILTFTFWSFFTFVGIKVAFIFLPILGALVGVVRRIIQLVLDFLPF